MISRLIGEYLKKSYFFLELSPVADLDFTSFCNFDISKSITARSSKLGQLIEDDDRLIVKTKKKHIFFLIFSLCRFGL